jgi:UDP-2-acetamido-3-amino-2,3-dideoxy-glucuronate N-acetyltransferase
MGFFAHSSAIIDDGAQIGEGTKIWHFTHVMSGAIIGNKCNLGQNVLVGNKVILGDNVRIQNNVSVYEGVICEEDVFLGPGVVLTNVINPRSAISRKDQFKTTLIKRGATIGANATIICGIEIGEFAFIGAGAVVAKDVAPYALIIGNPGKQIGWMSEYGHRLEFNESGTAFCKETSQEYQLENNQVRRIR